jgi:glyoxylase-like metal-dependent hydrolase (beta-lactamase superfamily II)
MQPFAEVGERVYRRRYESLDLNVGVVIGEDEALVIDSRASHRQADELLAEISVLTTLPVRHLVNTHWHWDHVWGNARFPRVDIWGHERTRTEMIEHGEQARAVVLGEMSPGERAAVREVELVPPDRTFTAVADVVVGGRVVELRYHGRAHTNADIVIHVPDAGVSFLGDLIEEGAPPNFGDSYPMEWAVTLDVILPTLHATVVPGHGDIVDRQFVSAQRDEIAEVARLVGEVASGAERATSLAAMPYPETFGEDALRRGLGQITGNLR